MAVGVVEPLMVLLRSSMEAEQRNVPGQEVAAV